MSSLQRMGNGPVVDAMALMGGSGFVVYAGAALAESFFPTVMRDLPGLLYGVTVDDISNVTKIVNSSTQLSHMPSTRIVFEYGQSPSSFSSAVNSDSARKLHHGRVRRFLGHDPLHAPAIP